MKNITLPIKLDDDLQIVDAKGQLLVPSLIWKSDVYHIEQQKEIGQRFVHLFNEDALVPKDPTEPINPEVLNVFKKRGRPRKS